MTDSRTPAEQDLRLRRQGLPGRGGRRRAALLATVALIAVTGTTGAAAAEPSVAPVVFAPRVDVPSPPLSHLAVADLNDDGRVDIATSGDRDMSVLLARPGGGYDQTDYPRDDYSNTIAIGDVNRDTRPDIVTGNGDVQFPYIVTWLAQPDGSYTPVQYQAPYTSEDLALADFNSDGRLDILSASGGEHVTMFTQGAGGGYTRTDFKWVGARRRCDDVAVADFNGDLRPDFVVTDNARHGSVRLYLAKPSGRGYRHAVLPVGPDVADVAAADVSGDGRPDIVTATPGSSSVTVLVQTSDRSYDSHNYVAGGPARAVAIADLNGDGRTDIIATNESGDLGDDTLGVLLGRKSRGYTLTNYPILDDGYPLSLGVADMNGDAVLDVSVGNWGEAYISQFLQLAPSGKGGSPVFGESVPEGVSQ